ncbi:WAT1-related protein At5g64700-like [Musa acuminata AAA Group]|uniref:WAT1-related protein At5g64700-like n=1 Tax=Musa acuminata AAA Group TaxID=214697 RepID=UPI0031D5F704
MLNVECKLKRVISSLYLRKTLIASWPPMAAHKPYVAAVILQLTSTGYFVISKAAFDKGLSTFVFIFYRHAAASLLLAPLAVIFERRRSPPLTVMTALKLFMHAMLGITFSLNLYNVGVKYTSASVASATTNSVPVFTFFFAVLFRMESIKMKSFSGVGKALGVALCLAGVVMTALYRGPRIHPLNLHFPSGHHRMSHLDEEPAVSKTTWIKGTLFVITATMTWSLWFVLQGILMKEYPSKLLFTTLECLFATLQSIFVAMAFERDTSKWKLQLDVGLLAILYCGFMVTGVAFYIQTWCIEKKGPVFLAVFTPLSLVFTIICSSIFLGEMISLGSILGGLLMVGGLYCVLWGKNKESVTCEASVEDGNSQSQKEAT